MDGHDVGANQCSGFQGSPGNRGFPGADGLPGPKVQYISDISLHWLIHYCMIKFHVDYICLLLSDVTRIYNVDVLYGILNH